MRLPEYEWVQFAKTPLKLVVVQVRFTTLLRFEQKSFIAGFQEAIRDDYPKMVVKGFGDSHRAITFGQ